MTHEPADREHVMKIAEEMSHKWAKTLAMLADPDWTEDLPRTCPECAMGDWRHKMGCSRRRG